MKRLKSVVAEILQALESSDDGAMLVFEIEAAIGDDSAPSGAVEYHVKLAIDRGLVARDGEKVRLTWAGHDAIEESRTGNDSMKIWAKLA